MSAILGTSVTGSTGAYTIDNSLRLRSSASAYFNRLPSVAGNRQKWTWSAWLKLGSTSSSNKIFATYTDANNQDRIIFGNGSLLFATSVGGVQYTVASNATYRDPSAWYHVVVAVDTTQATAANRMILYVNGSAVTLNGPSYPPQNTNLNINNTVQHYISGHSGTSEFYDGYIAELNFIDGQQLTPSSFGATNASTGVWQPAKYTGTYGTNGFYQKYDSVGATSSGTGNTGYGKDSSGNGNWYGTNNISSTAGVTYDAMTDSPTPKSSTVGNYCVMSPIDKSSSVTISNANLQFASGTANTMGRATMGVSSGKWYWEVFASSVSASTIGVVDASETNVSTYVGSVSTSYSYYSGATKYNNGSSSAYGATWTTNDIIGVALDMDAGTITFYKNGVSQGQAYSGLSGTKIPAISSNTGSSTQTLIANFGQRPFTYTPPSGYNRLQTYNLPTPTIGASSTTLANKYMDITTYTGNGSAGRVITMSNMNNVGFAWVKIRSSADDHRLANTVTGGNRHLKSNNTDAESTGTNMIQAFSSNTFTIGSDTGVNANGSTYVGWCWANDGTSGSTNTAGSITATVSANTASGFSVVTYTGNGTSGATVGHGLGSAPKMLITKIRNNTYEWKVWHTSLSSGYQLILNNTAGQASDPTVWTTTTPTSSVFSVGSNVATNQSTGQYVTYCFAEVTGFSKFGSYTGNNSSDGPFIYTGFRPKYVMTKLISSSGGDFAIIDTARSTYNISNTQLWANSSSGDNSTVNCIDILSNGFKVRASGITNFNASGGTYIYMAFAENPFNYSLAR